MLFARNFVRMKFPLILLSLLSVSAGFAKSTVELPTAAPASDDVLLAAIADVETGNNSAKRGRYGERTRLQIRPETWRQFSTLPHSASAANLEETDRVGRAYLAVIRNRLRSRGLPETPFFIAASWNAGPGWRRLRPATVSYAERVANLVEASQPPGDVRAIVPSTTPLAVPAQNQRDSALVNVSRVPVISLAIAN